MQISKRKIGEKAWESWWDKIAKLLSQRHSTKDFGLVFGLILSKSEKIMMAKRLMIGYLLIHDWHPYRIADEVKVSVSTVYKHAELMEDNQAYKQLLHDVFPDPPKKITPENQVSKLLNAMLEGRGNRRKLYELNEGR